MKEGAVVVAVGVNAAHTLGGDGIGGLSPSPEEEGDGDLGCMGWCASQPRLCSKGACEKTGRQVEVSGY